jgi:hypothetical protein
MKARLLKELCGGWERDTKLNMLKEMRRTYGKEYVVKKYERISLKERREDRKIDMYDEKQVL